MTARVRAFPGPCIRRVGVLGTLATLLASPLLAGCSDKPRQLETGYRYEPLNSTSVQRRAFYADPYSIEARRAEMERQQRMEGTTGFGLGR